MNFKTKIEGWKKAKKISKLLNRTKDLEKWAEEEEDRFRKKKEENKNPSPEMLRMYALFGNPFLRAYGSMKWEWAQEDYLKVAELSIGQTREYAIERANYCYKRRNTEIK